MVDSTKGVDDTSWVDFIASKVVVSDEVLAWLIDIKSVWKLLSSQEESKGISSIVWSVRLSDLNGVIGQVVVENVRKVFADGEESQHLSILVQELLLGGNLSTTEALLKVLQKLNVSLWRNWNTTLSEFILWAVLCGWLLSSLFLSQNKSLSISCRFETSLWQISV